MTQTPDRKLDPIWIMPAPTPKDRKCGACAGLYRTVLKGKETCSTAGATENSRACTQFKLDHHVLLQTPDTQTADQDPIMSMLEAIRNAPVSLLQYVPHLLVAEARIRQHVRRNLLAQVFFKWQGRGYYLSNYAQGMIIDADRSHVTLLGSNGKTIYTMLQSEFRNMALTADEWESLKAKMIDRGRIHDPILPIKAKKLYNAKIEVPSFDQVDEADGKAMRKAVQRADLATLLTEIQETGTISRTYDSIKKPTARLKFGYADQQEQKATTEIEAETEAPF